MSLTQAIEIVKSADCTRMVRTTYDKEFVEAVKETIIEELSNRWADPVIVDNVDYSYMGKSLIQDSIVGTLDMNTNTWTFKNESNKNK